MKYRVQVEILIETSDIGTANSEVNRILKNGYCSTYQTGYGNGLNYIVSAITLEKEQNL